MKCEKKSFLSQTHFLLCIVESLQGTPASSSPWAYVFVYTPTVVQPQRWCRRRNVSLAWLLWLFMFLRNETDYADELHSLSEGSTPVPLDIWGVYFQSTVSALLVLRVLGLLGARCPAARLQNKHSCELPHQHLILERSPFHITKKEGENIRKSFLEFC